MFSSLTISVLDEKIVFNYVPVNKKFYFYFSCREDRSSSIEHTYQRGTHSVFVQLNCITFTWWNNFWYICQVCFWVVGWVEKLDDKMVGEKKEESLIFLLFSRVEKWERKRDGYFLSSSIMFNLFKMGGLGRKNVLHRWFDNLILIITIIIHVVCS